MTHKTLSDLKKREKKENGMSDLKIIKDVQFQKTKQRITWTPDIEITGTQGTRKTLSDFKKNWEKKKWDFRSQKKSRMSDLRKETQKNWNPRYSDCRGTRDVENIYLKIGFLEYLRISGEIRCPNGPIGYWKKVTIWKEACIVHVGAVIHDHQGGEAIWSRKCLWWKDCPGNLTSLNTARGVSVIRPGPGFIFIFQSASHPSANN